MPRLLIISVPLLVLVFAASACDGGGVTSPTPEATPEATPTPDPTPTPESKPAGTTSRVTPPSDAGEYLKQFADKEIVRQRCTLDRDAGQVDCSENGVYEPEPPLAEENAWCDILLVDEEPIALACSLELAVTYYAISP